MIIKGNTILRTCLRPTADLLRRSGGELAKYVPSSWRLRNPVFQFNSSVSAWVSHSIWNWADSTWNPWSSPWLPPWRLLYLRMRDHCPFHPSYLKLGSSLPALLFLSYLELISKSYRIRLSKWSQIYFVSSFFLHSLQYWPLLPTFYLCIHHDLLKLHALSNPFIIQAGAWMTLKYKSGHTSVL